MFRFNAMIIVSAMLFTAPVAASPVEKVVELLKNMEIALDADQTAEQATYDKFACYCESTSTKTVSSMIKAKDDLKKLGQSILKFKGTVAIRSDEIEKAQEGIKSNQDAQDMATAARGKENKAWQSESAETTASMDAINQAMNVLTKATKPALLQVDMTASLMASVTAVVDSAPLQALEALEPEKLSTLRSFAQIRDKAGYAPQSATIQGIFSDMYTTMGVTLMDSTAAEAGKNRAFESFMFSKEKEMNQLTTLLARKQKEKAEAETSRAESTEAFDDTSKQLEADTELLTLTKQDCTEKTQAWTERSRLRAEETKGIKGAIDILDAADAKTLFAGAIKPGMESSFLQLDSTTQLSQEKRAAVDKLYNKLKERATKSHSFRLAALAAHVRMAKAGHFDAVLKAIDSLVEVLAGEQKADLKKRDECKDQYQKIAQKSNDLTWNIEKNDAKILKLGNMAKAFVKERGLVIGDITAANKNIAEMKATRIADNAAFIKAKNDDNSAIALLKSAKETMMAFYDKNKVDMGKIQGSVKLMESESTDDAEEEQAPDATFSGKGERKNQAKGIVSIITMITEDLEAEVANGVKAEASAQSSYEKALAAANKLVEDLEAKKISLGSAKAKADSDKNLEDGDRTTNQKDLKTETDAKAALSTDCDYMIEKFTERKTARTAESEALNDAKVFLSQYVEAPTETPSLVQMPASRDSSFQSITFSHFA